MNVRPDDFIMISSWERLCHGLGVAYGPTESATELFARASGPTTVVTAHSDYGVWEQAAAHPNADLGRLAVMTDWAGIGEDRGEYKAVMVGPACDRGRCDPSHRYSLKTDRYTWETFAGVPDHVRWFTTNLNCDLPRAELIPFGLNDHGPGAGLLPDHLGRAKTELLYLNFQDNSLERLRLKQRYAGEGWVTYRRTADVPVATYLDELSRHRFALCPPGCGLDSYRVWECVYLGVVPVMHDSPFSRRLAAAGLPVAVVSDPLGLTPAFLQKVWGAFSGEAFDYDFARLSHWKQRLSA